MTAKTGSGRERLPRMTVGGTADSADSPTRKHCAEGPAPESGGLPVLPIGRAGAVLFCLQTLLMSPATVCLLTVSTASAQNVSITDYVVPVSRAHNLRIDALSFNYATEGDETVVQHGNVTVVYKKFYESLPYAYSVDATGHGSIRKNISPRKTNGTP